MPNSSFPHNFSIFYFFQFLHLSTLDWTDDFWPLVIQLYQEKPVGIKPMYSRGTVRLALETHIKPQTLYQKMFQLRQPHTPSLQRLLEKYAHSPKKLAKACKILRQMNGMGNPSEFYDEVAINETWELDFKPVNSRTAQITNRPLYTPVMLTLILDLYFRLIPATMIADTPDVKDLAKMIDVTPADVVDVLTVYQYCDPFIKHADDIIDPLLSPCFNLWQQYATDDLTDLNNIAQQLQAYFK